MMQKTYLGKIAKLETLLTEKTQEEVELVGLLRTPLRKAVFKKPDEVKLG